MARILLAGVPGIGKTSILAALAHRLVVPVVNFGTAMLEYARSQGYTRDRDGLRAVPADTARTWREAAAARIASACIIDGHVVVRTPDGFMDAIPEALRAPGFLQGIVLLEAPALEIQARRASRDRPRATEAPADIERNVVANRTAARHLAVTRGLTFHIMDTAGLPPDEAATRLGELLPPSFLRPDFK